MIHLYSLQRCSVACWWIVIVVTHRAAWAARQFPARRAAHRSLLAALPSLKRVVAAHLIRRACGGLTTRVALWIAPTVAACLRGRGRAARCIVARTIVCLERADLTGRGCVANLHISAAPFFIVGEWSSATCFVCRSVVAHPAAGGFIRNAGVAPRTPNDNLAGRLVHQRRAAMWHFERRCQRDVR